MPARRAIHCAALLTLTVSASHLAAADLDPEFATLVSHGANATISDGGCGNCCDDCGCDLSSCCDDCPLWTIRGGAVFLHRSQPNSAVLMESLDGTPFLLRANQFEFNTEAGPDLYLMRHGETADLDVRFFMVDGWNSTLGPEFVPVDTIVDFGSPLISLLDSNDIFFYKSELHSAEANLRHNVTDRWTWLAGFRYVELDERLGVNSNFGGGDGFNDAHILSRATNYLSGFQIGADAILWDNGARLRLESYLKAGIYYNRIHTSAEVLQGVGDNFFLRDADDHAAFVGEYAFTGVYQASDHVALRAGYQLLFLEGVAVASDQLAVQNFLGGTTIDTGGSVFYHGATAALEIVW